ncbi:MAG: SAM-dependent methyltransferase [Treponema sp.]|nr:SAM-dependent methyltransferase [Treponema sp.]
MPVRIEEIPGTVFLPFPDMSGMLESELAERFSCSTSDDAGAEQYGDLLYLPGFKPEQKDSLHVPYWCRTAMLEPFILHFDSIGEAAAALREKQRSWAPYQYQLFRRAGFIQEKLPYVNLKTRTFPAKIPQTPIGLYTLLDANTIIASARTTSFIPAGLIQFEENHEEPPSRAYLKIQESLTMAQLLFGAELPHAGQSCFEAGACPGGWTWVLVKLGCRVHAVDRAELVPELMHNPLVKFQAHDAFTLKPDDIGPCDWVFSDVICYPERLFEWVQEWLSSGLVKNMICTIKMQGDVDWKLAAEFAAIPDSRVVHLNYNKHELTWIHCGK